VVFVSNAQKIMPFARIVYYFLRERNAISIRVIFYGLVLCRWYEV